MDIHNSKTDIVIFAVTSELAGKELNYILNSYQHILRWFFMNASPLALHRADTTDAARAAIRKLSGPIVSCRVNSP